MKSVKYSSNRFVVVAGIATALMTITLVAVLLVPGRSLAHVDEPDRAEPVEPRTGLDFPPAVNLPLQTPEPFQAGTDSSPKGPIPVPPLNPPIQTPEPGQVMAAPPDRMSLNVDVVEFRPNVRLVRGQSVEPSQDATKPARQREPDVTKPAVNGGSSTQGIHTAPNYAQVLAPMGWSELLYEGFVGFSPPGLGTAFNPTRGTSVWTVYDFVDDGLERTWGATDWKSYYHDDDPSDDRSVWPVAFGADALDPSGGYTNTLKSWLDYGPMDLSNMSDLLVSFGLWHKTEVDFDKIKFCASIDGYTYYCDYWSGDSGGWTDQAFRLTSYAGYPEVWLAWVFQSDGSITDDGPYVDEIWAWGEEIGATPSPTPTPDPAGELVENGSFEEDGLKGWQTSEPSPTPSDPIQNGDFENGPDGSWTEYSTHGWPLIVDSFPGSVAPYSGSWAVWLGGEYDDISAIIQSVTIPSGSPILSYWHWIASADACGKDFGKIIVGTTVEGIFDLCDSADTYGWVRRTVDLSAYVGQTIELQIRAETDSSGNSNLFIDDVELGSSAQASVRQEGAVLSPLPAEGEARLETKGKSEIRQHRQDAGVRLPSLLTQPRNESKQDPGESLAHHPSAPMNPSALETPTDTEQKRDGPQLRDLLRMSGMLGIAEVGVSGDRHIDGNYAAYLWRDTGPGLDKLFQTITVPSDAADVVLNFWFSLETYETTVGYDWFCASMANPADHQDIWVDLGCIDATDTAPYWQEVLYSLDSSELGTVVGSSTDLIFYLFSDVDYYGLGGSGAGSTKAWVDDVRVYATGGSAGESVDPNEPNDDATSATSISCSETMTTGVIGDALGGYDIDWFRIDSVPTGRIDIDIDADTQVPPSALDSVVRLWDGSVTQVAWNDDDGVSYDSYVTYTVGTAGTYYVSVESYSGNGSADSFYDLTVQCGGSGGGPPPADDESPEEEDAWTVMLFLNAEDSNFESILTKYRTDIEQFIGSMSGFLNVVILYDGAGDGNTTRYLVQPGGNYTDGTNYWQLGERNMGHPSTLQTFVSWAMDQYPAEHYYLAIDDHGDGVYGISVDPTSSNDQLTPREVYAALKSATRNGARKIDILDYEACLMGIAENAYDVRQWVDYVVFSEQISWGIDTYPVYFRDLAATDTPRDVGTRIVDRYSAGASAGNGGKGFPHTISLIDTGKMLAVRDAVSNFGNAIKGTGTQARKDAANNARNHSQAFAADIDATSPIRAEYIDLWDLADQASSLAPTQAAAVKSAVEAAVVREQHASGGIRVGDYLYRWNHQGAHGLAIYYPPSKSSSAFRGYSSLYQMSQEPEGKWDEFLEWALPPGIGRGMGSFRAEIRLTGGETFVDRFVFLPLVLK